MTKREAISDILQVITTDGLPGPRDVDVAIDAIFSILDLDEVGEPKKALGDFPPSKWRSSVFITIGNRRDFAIKEKFDKSEPAQIAIIDRSEQGMSLGPATEARITNLQRYLETLKGLVPS